MRNVFGKIRWAEPVDLTGVNLDLAVSIKQNAIEVYPDDIYDKLSRPELGSGLNRPALITIYNKFPKKGENVADYVKRLKMICDSQSAEFIKYNPDKGKCKFRVSQF